MLASPPPCSPWRSPWLQPASPWYLVVSAPTLSTARAPFTAADLTAFRIPHGVFVKLHRGTWHAGAAVWCGAMCVYACDAAPEATHSCSLHR